MKNLPAPVPVYCDKMSWLHGSAQVDSGFQNNNIFASKSTSQPASDGNKADRFPLYIVNIPVNVNEDQLKTMFNQCGEVIHSKCLAPKEGRSCTVGFITFATEEEAEKAISMFNETRLDGQTLRVDYTKSFKEQRAQNTNKGNSPFFSGNNSTSSSTNRDFGRLTSPEQSNVNGLHGLSQQSSGPVGIGRGIHYGSDDGYQPGSTVNRKTFNAAPGTPFGYKAGTQDSSSSNQSNYGQSNYQNNFQAPAGDSSYQGSQSYSPQPDSSDVNTMVNGFGAMHVSQPADQSHSFEQNLMNGNETYESHGQSQAYEQNQSSETNQSYSQEQTYTSNAYDQNQAYGENQPQNVNQVYGENTAYEQNYSYDQNQAYSENSAYGESQVYNQNQVYGQNQAYDQNQTDQTQQYEQNQSYGQGQTYDQNQGYDQNQAYDQSQSYDTSQAYDQNTAYDQNQMYGQDQLYDQNQAYGQHEVQDQKQAYGENQYYGQSQSQLGSAIGDQTNQIYGQEEIIDQQQTYRDNQTFGQKHEHAQSTTQNETSIEKQSFDQMFGGQSNETQQLFQVSSRLPRSQNDSSGGNGRNCHNGGEPGHFSRECPTKKSQGGGCHRCGESGHFARECPNSSGGGGSSGQSSCPRPAMRIDYVPPPLPDDVDMLFKSAVHKGINFDRFDNIPVEVTGNDPPAAMQTFDELLLPDTLKSNLAKAEFTKPTPVQKHGMPIILSGRDVMACAQTGSGKTVAFLLPVMAGMVNNRLAEASYLGGDAPCPAALCIAPTRELASQIYTEALKFSSGTYLRAVVCYGGVSVAHQLSKLERGCHILIGTPGRILDFVGRNRVSLSKVRYLILDEADRMLDMGFENDMRKIITQFGMPQKTERQTLMFSATFPDEIQKLAREFLNDYLFLAVGSVGGSNLDIKQEVLDVQGSQKRSVLMEILGQSGTDKTLVFVERKRNADFLANWLSQNKYPATSISGDRTQQEREEALRDFRTGRAPILIATSVAARGLDIPGVKHVINYDLPQQIEEYVHRIGRTGRIGNQGRATAFFERGKDDKLARSLVKVLSDALQDIPNWIEEVAERALGTNYGPSGGKFASRDTRQFGGGGISKRNSQPRQTTNISLVNTPSNAQQNGDEEEWE